MFLLLPMRSLSSVSVQLYSPLRPLVDIAEVFLWLMAVGTILFASYWSAWSAREAAIEHDKLLKVILCLFGSYFVTFLLLWGLNSCWVLTDSIKFYMVNCCVQDASDDSSLVEGEGSSPLVEITPTAAILFVVIASCFLVMFYKLMSFWFIEILVVLFCIGGIEVSCFCIIQFSHYGSNFLIKHILVNIISLSFVLNSEY